MKTHSANKSSRLILSSLIAASASFAFAASSSAQDNAISAFPFSVDGQFSNGLTATDPIQPIGEWSDVTPADFISAPGQNPTSVPVGDPRANSALYAAIGNDITLAGVAGTPAPSLHLLYDFVPRTNQLVLPGEVVASVTFPVHLPGDPDPNNRTNITVLVEGSQLLLEKGAGVQVFRPSLQFLVDLDGDGIGDEPASALGLEGAAGFGPSPLSSTPHLIVELGVGLRIPAGFGSGGPLNPQGNGIDPSTGLYSPDPAFWGAAGSSDGSGGLPAAADGGDLQPASAANFAINPDGSITVTPVPEPASVGLLLAGLGFLGARRRR